MIAVSDTSPLTKALFELKMKFISLHFIHEVVLDLLGNAILRFI